MNTQLAELSMVASEIEDVVDNFVQKSCDWPEVLLLFRPTENAWCIKEIIGHLIDSASNNHQRMVRLQIKDQLEFPDYQHDNDKWVNLQGYTKRPWPELLALWQQFNRHIAHLIRSVDERCLHRVWIRDSQSHIPLADLMRDYLRHLRLHVEQIDEIKQRYT
jgi:hypothetical protein